MFKVGVPTIELIELFPCGSKDELRAREGFHQRATDCVNKNIAGRSKAAYNEENQQHILEQQAEYRVANRQKISDRMRVYLVANRPQINERDRARYAAIKRTERLTLFIQKHIENLSPN